MATNAMNQFQHLRKVGKSDGLRAQLTRGGVGSIVVKIGQTALAFTVAVVLARTLGPNGYGVYAFALALITMLSIPAQIGLPQLVVRETAKAQSNEDWALMHGLWLWSIRIALAFSAAVPFVAFSVLWLVNERVDEARLTTLSVGLFLIPLIALASLCGAALRGLRHVVIGQLPEQILRPGLLVISFLGVAALVPAVVLTPARAMLIYVFVSAVTLAIGVWLLWRFNPIQVRSATIRIEGKYWRGVVIPLALIAGIQLINKQADIIMLGVFRSDAEVGIYRVVSQASLLIVFGLQAINSVLMPHFVRLYHSAQPERLQRLVTQSARVIFLFAIPPAILFIVFGEALLALVFGSEYGTGHAALAILAIGQLASAAMGSVATLLNMTGHERDTMGGVLIAAVGNVFLNLLFIPLYGIEGAAITTSLTYIVWNYILHRKVKQRIKIDTTAFGNLRINHV